MKSLHLSSSMECILEEKEELRDLKRPRGALENTEKNSEAVVNQSELTSGSCPCPRSISPLYPLFLYLICCKIFIENNGEERPSKKARRGSSVKVPLHDVTLTQFYEAIRPPRNSPPLPKQPPGFEVIQLFPYQLRCVNWMVHHRH